MTDIDPAAATFENDPDAIPVSQSTLQSMRIAKVFHDNDQPITSLSFDDAGEYSITTSSDESLHLYDCRYGQLRKTLFSKKYGADLARFTHHSSNIIYASAKGSDHALRYLSVHDNRYLAYFSGHEDRVVGLYMSPTDDSFLSASLDRTARLWDLRTPQCQGLLHLPELASAPCVAYDPCGLVFAAAVGTYGTVRLYDIKNYDGGPFSTFKLTGVLQAAAGNDAPIQWTAVKFSSDGKRLLLVSAADAHCIVDSFSGELLYRLMGHTPVVDSTGEEVCFTPDGQFVLSGSQDGTIYCWKLDATSPSQCVTLQPLCTLEGHLDVSRIVNFNPRYAMMATGCSDLFLTLGSQFLRAYPGGQNLSDLTAKGTRLFGDHG
ncbi:hypothetical protein IWQ60_010287 [Tieghemiomyces parasiticus]|uniref:WD40 repeat-like protein n=1 Tax=Tieghemiomyces parasiticus TaxID=78921 RepID=A0A9W7ZK80_9FUNG|nr:hypothetical protein IWQ60_010287 [Tieghemiomyces parasiticus]